MHILYLFFRLFNVYFFGGFNQPIMETQATNLKYQKETKRAKNFKEIEINYLLSLVMCHKDVIENKRTDQSSFKDKERAWKEIEEDFNRHREVYYRDAKTLRKKYENLKKSSKRKWADEKKYVMGTGGGPVNPIEITSTDVKVRELLGDLTVMGEKSKFDSDANNSHRSHTETDTDSTFFEGGEALDVQVIIPFDNEYAENQTIEDIDNQYIYENENFECLNNQHTNENETIEDLDNHVIENQTIKDLNNHDVLSPILVGCKKLFDVSTSSKTEGASKSKVNSDFDKHFTVKHLRSKTSSPLRLKRKTAAPLDNTLAGRKIQILSKTKESLLELQKVMIEKQTQYQEEENHLKMKCMKEEHEKKMKLLDLQIKNEELALMQKKRDFVKTSSNFEM
jgi:hypothetical protein